MSLIFQYVLKLSISLAVVYLFYHCFLRRLTFYNSNRWYLILYSFCSFLIPLINISPVLLKSQLNSSPIVQYIPAVSSSVSMQNPGISKSIAYGDARLAAQWFLILLLLGMFIMFVRLLIHFFSFLKVRKSARLLISHPVKIFQVDSRIIPFSIGGSIYLNQHLHNEEEMREIIRHEFIHVKEKHSIDILLGEFLCVMNWFNPFAWSIRKAIRENLEFIADSKVLESGLNRKEYQCLLLKVIGISQFSLATQFNFSSLKKRIAMMNKKQSAKAQLLKLLLLLPVLTIVLLAFRGVTRQNSTSFQPISKNFYTDTVPKPPPPPKPESADQPQFPHDLADFLKRNPEVKNVNWRNGMMTIELKSGVRETYDLSDESIRIAAEKKYGELPVPPPPPPPPPAKPKLPKDVRTINITEQKAIVILDNGKREEYDLTNPKEKTTYEKKYGRLEQMEPIDIEELEKEELLQQKEKESEMVRIHEHRARENELRQQDFLRSMEDRKMELDRKQDEFNEMAQMRRQELMNDARAHQMELKQKQSELERESLMRKHDLQRDSQEKEQELMRKQYELSKDLEMQKQEIMNLSDQQNRDIQRIYEQQLKKATPMNKEEAITQLESEKLELQRVIQELKSRELELNKKLDQLKKDKSKKD